MRPEFAQIIIKGSSRPDHPIDRERDIPSFSAPRNSTLFNHRVRLKTHHLPIIQIIPPQQEMPRKALFRATLLVVETNFTTLKHLPNQSTNQPINQSTIHCGSARTATSFSRQQLSQRPGRKSYIMRPPA
jgi:hypothetical protein